jgi:hypothetical protein
LFRKRPESGPDPEPPASFLSEEISAERREARGQLVRLSIGFALLFCAVFFAFWWSGSAVRFGASRVADTTIPTYEVSGTVQNSRNGEPVPWAVIQDDPAGRPPFFRTDAGQQGAYTLLTLAEPHRVIVTANGYKTLTISVGRQWFLWLPRGKEQRDLQLTPE